MEKLVTDIVVIGGGPAGMAAAIEAAKIGANVTIVDEKAKPGGQIYKQFPKGFEINEMQLEKKYLDKDYLEGQRIIRELGTISERINMLSSCMVWSIFPDKKVAIVQNEKNVIVACKKLIIAEGVYERPMPFPGWTLPGVLTAGCAQTLVKTQRVLPGDKILLSGSGPLQLVLANQLVKAGARVQAVLEASAMWGIKHLPPLLADFGILREGLRHLYELRKLGVPFLTRHAILEAQGEKEVTVARYAKLDKYWRPVAGTEKEMEVDTVCLGYGFISSIRLSQLCGCEHQYDQVLQCWIPKRSDQMETTSEGIFAVGDCAGIAGHLVAIEEGRIAGIRASQQLKLIDDRNANDKCRSIISRLNRLYRFETGLNKIFTVRPGLYSRLKDDTIICRCEEVTAGEIRSAVAATGRRVNLNEIKKMTRAGMGDCQGRMCMSSVAAMISAMTELSVESLGQMTCRAPVKPIPISAFV